MRGLIILQYPAYFWNSFKSLGVCTRFASHRQQADYLAQCLHIGGPMHRLRHMRKRQLSFEPKIRMSAFLEAEEKISAFCMSFEPLGAWRLVLSHDAARTSKKIVFRNRFWLCVIFVLEGVETDRARELLFSTGHALYIDYCVSTEKMFSSFPEFV